jgi:hypothetical protein
VKTRTVTERVAEELGPVDWSHPMVAEVEARRPGLIAMLREAEQNPESFEVTTDGGGWPRVGWGQVLRVVMYDGWPYWRPTPTVVSMGWAGVRHDPINSISELRWTE